jgi:hypothetical protein
MSSTPYYPLSRATQPATGNGLVQVLNLIKLTLISGPKILLTSQISVKCAAVMIGMCAPALLFCALLTIPGLVFQSPQQNAYFYFAKVLEQDPTCWFVLLLTGLCALLSLALPATMDRPSDAALC